MAPEAETLPPVANGYRVARFEFRAQLALVILVLGALLLGAGVEQSRQARGTGAEPLAIELANLEQGVPVRGIGGAVLHWVRSWFH